MDTDRTSPKLKPLSNNTSPNAKPAEKEPVGSFEELLKLPKGTKFRVLPDKPK